MKNLRQQPQAWLWNKFLRRFGRLSSILAASSLLWISTTGPARAQSAADKATARQLATEGIKLFRQKEHAQALDKLQRAQALFDAPVHLLYIGRSQVALGRLVEGSETYRALERVELGPGAPKAFVEAKAAGEKELQALLPRVPKLTIDVEPNGVSDLRILLGEEQLPAAVEGVERPVNPGTYTVSVDAPGHDGAEQSITIDEGASERVTLVLTPRPEPEPDEMQPSDGPDAPEISQPPQQDFLSSLGFEIGLRGGALLLTGEAAAGKDLDQIARLAGGGEVYAALRFLRYFGVGAFYTHHWPSRDTGRRLLEQFPAPAEVVDSAEFDSLGILARGATARGEFGGFGEIGLGLLHQLAINRDVINRGTMPDCSFDQTFSGMAVRIAAGGIIPVNRWLRLTPMAAISFSSFSSVGVETDCLVNVPMEAEPRRPDPLLVPKAGDIEKPSGHRMIFLGLGGDLLFGAD